jgi:DNA-binding NarL/FixJ family response regulator
MDVVMPVMNGLDATARVCASSPKTRVIILSMNSTPEYVLQSLRAGAAGYLLKDDGPAVLEAAIRAVARGENYLCSGVSKYVVSGYVHRDRGVERLTPRQREVLQLIAEGATTKQMARKLGISAKTVETHRSQLMQALDIHDVAGLVRYAIRMGLIVPT